MKPSKFQQAIFDFIVNDTRSAVIEAVAGAGKTTTIVKALELIPDDKTILFCAFNRAIANELSERVPEYVTVKTMNGLGHSAWLRHVGGGVQLDSNKTYEILKSDEFLEAISVTDSRAGKLRPKVRRLVALAKQVGLVPDGVEDAKGLVKDTMEVWDAMIEHHDIDFLDDDEKLGKSIEQIKASISADKEDAIAMARVCLKMGLENWNVIDFDDQLYMTVVYGCRLYKNDFVFVDEAQDISAIQRELLSRALEKDGRLIAVGDPHQCHPAGTKILCPSGRERKIENLKAGDPVVAWNRGKQSFHGLTTQSPKVKVASRHYSGPMLTIEAGWEEVQCTPNHKWTVKLKKTPDLWATYIMEKDGAFRIGWCQVFCKNGLFHIGQRTRIERAHRAWILECYESKQAASLAESMISAKYGIPTIQFRETVSVPTLYKQRALDLFWLEAKANLNLREKVKQVLEHYGRDIQYPIYRNYKTGKQIKTTVMEIQACNIIPHIMMVPAPSKDSRHSQWKEITGVEEDDFDGTVYSLEVPTHGHYVANGLVVHNSIYGFRGADSESLNNIAKKFKCVRLPLSISYRCPKAVVREAQKFVKHIEPADTAPEGKVIDLGTYNPADMKTFVPGDFVICRNTAPLVRLAFDLIRAKKPAKIAGQEMGKSLINLIQKLRAASLNQLAEKLDVWREKEITRILKKDPDASTHTVDEKYECIQVFMQCSGARSVAALINSITDIFVEAAKEDIVTLSTIHKSKGLEAKRVIFLDSFLLPSKFAKKPWQKEQEKNLSYVGITRAQDTLAYVTSPSKEDRMQMQAAIRGRIIQSAPALGSEFPELYPDRVEKFGNGEIAYSNGIIVGVDDGNGRSWDADDVEDME